MERGRRGKGRHGCRAGSSSSRLRGAVALAALLGLWTPASALPAAAAEQALEVTVTAYNSVPEQTDAQPTVAAWGDHLEPGMKVIAVSRDLIELGLRHGTVVHIEGLDGDYVVLDKMNRRWRGAIDLYMGKDISAARRFGRQQRRITWNQSVAGERPPTGIALPAVASGPSTDSKPRVALATEPENSAVVPVALEAETN